jgi:tetratricopeptide (TPR) repeat protein
MTVLVIAAASPAASPPKPAAAAAALIDKGAALYESGDYAKAAASLRAAYELVPEARLLFNIARAYERVGDGEQAFEFYERYLDATGTEAELRHRARDALKRMRTATEDPAAGASPANPPPAVAAPPPAPAPPIPSAAPPSVAPPVLAPAPVAPAAAVEENVPRTPTRVPGIILVSVGAASVATGAGFGIWALNTAQQTRASLDPVQKPTLRSRAYTEANVADVTLAVGAAAAAVGTWLWWRSPKTGTPAVSLGPAGLSAQWTVDW